MRTLETAYFSFDPVHGLDPATTAAILKLNRWFFERDAGLQEIERVYNGIDFSFGSAHFAYTGPTLTTVMLEHDLCLSPVGTTGGTDRALLMDTLGNLYEYYQWYDPTKGDPWLSQPFPSIHDYLNDYLRRTISGTQFWIEYWQSDPPQG